MVAMPVFNFCNTKFVLIVCLFLNSFSLLLFTFTNNFYVLSLSRMLVGFFQVSTILVTIVAIILAV